MKHNPGRNGLVDLFSSKKRANLLVAVAVAVVVIIAGYSIWQLRAAGFFAAAELEQGTLAGNAQLVNDAGASGGKAVQFKAPDTPPPSDPPPQEPTARSCPAYPAFPDANCTGVTPGTSLTIVTGDQTFGSSYNGQTISGKDFRGFVTVTGANITFKNCIFRGRAAPSNENKRPLSTVGSTGTITIEDSEFAPSNPSATLDAAIYAKNTNIYRANIYGGVDGVKAESNTLIQDSWIHDLSWFASDPNQGGGETHNDGVQSALGESNITLRHNRIDLTTSQNANAALQTSASNTRVENNYLDGGGCILNFSHVSGPLTNIYITGNHFGRHSAFQCPILLSTQTTLNQNSGNVWADTLTPIPPPQQHD